MVLDLSTAGTSDISVGVQTRTHVVVVIFGVIIVETGISPMEIYCHSLEIFPNNEVHDNTERATVYRAKWDCTLIILYYGCSCHGCGSYFC